MFSDLHNTCLNLEQPSVEGRLVELSGALPPASITAVGGFPIIETPSGFKWCGNSVDDIPSHLKDALGLSAVLTYTNKSNKSLEELGNICIDKNHNWAYHWINVSITFTKHLPIVELSFARDTRFYLSWVVSKLGYSEVFTATASIKDWVDYTNHEDDSSFDISTRQAMKRARPLIMKLI